MLGQKNVDILKSLLARFWCGVFKQTSSCKQEVQDGPEWILGFFSKDKEEEEYYEDEEEQLGGRGGGEKS